VRVPRLVRRLLGRETSAGAEAARYAAADDLERRTQSHYREVTGVDSKGRETRRDREPPP